jgi:hypothetical protein
MLDKKLMASWVHLLEYLYVPLLIPEYLCESLPVVLILWRKAYGPLRLAVQHAARALRALLQEHVRNTGASTLT